MSIRNYFMPDIFLSGIPNIHNFQHEFSNETLAFLRLREPNLHQRAIDFFSRVGFELKVEERTYQLKLGWG